MTAPYVRAEGRFELEALGMFSQRSSRPRHRCAFRAVRAQKTES